MKSFSHSIEYKGHTIICDNGLYYVAGRVYWGKFFTINPCKDLIDEMTAESEKSNVSTIYKRKTHQ